MADDFQPLGPDVAAEVALLAPAQDSELPAVMIEAQIALSNAALLDLARRFHDLLIAVALRRPGATPAGVLRELAGFKVMSDERWRQWVSPELRRVLAERGVTFE